MARRKTSDDAAGKTGSRASQGSAVAEGAALSALTTTLLAGAVTGAVAGVAGARAASDQARAGEPLHHDQPTFAHPALNPEAVSPKGELPRVTSLPGDSDQDAGVQASTTAVPTELDGDAVVAQRSGAPSPIERAGEPFGATSAEDRDVAQSGTGDGADTATAGIDLAARGVAETPPAQAAVATSAIPLAHDAADAGASLIETVIVRLEDELGTVKAELAQVVQAMQARTDQSGDTIAQTIAATTNQMTSMSAELTAATAKLAEDLAQSVADALPIAVRIPATVLGADQDDRELDGFLARLFDAPQLIEAPEPQDAGAAEAGAPAAAEEGLAPAGPDAFLPELAGTIEAVTIGFAGISYADALDAQDGPSGSHANLLHGLL